MTGQGEALAAVVAAMDRLRSPGGCPWDAEQTHRSLAPYAVEEAFELAEAAESDDRDALRGELGDLLLQVLFHARVAEEHPSDPFGLDDVAQVLLDKLVRRHPHVFAEADAARSAADVEAAWHEIKKLERTGEDVLAGIPLALPALARAQKVTRRLRREGTADDVLLDADSSPAVVDEEAALGRELMGLVLRAEDAGVDAEAALRAHLRRLQDGRGQGPS
ncbi:XTP/dITP diphosphohydrolase [Georgenia satyanarayanai]|uniref:XTP/dITP diphosphohydrolase n=1 Tax=Georgenia satyanarayanai TaxID=860221 RepID=A0A2Y9A3Z9_9MICO|nr:MazG family protein [Georgenia satyanarayanai]PYG00895.1 XTP/dITP diphosphohydrolase [Georgenia satyanarayanai]SSA39134.1 XTP/dITP diphosphohydrolase [Georgenia satyanarayanai]